MTDMTVRMIWLAVAILAASIVSLATAGLSFVDDHKLPGALVRGGAAFAGTIVMVLGAYAFLLQ